MMMQRLLNIILIGMISWVIAAPAHAARLETLVMPGKVTQKHAKYEEQCDKCHSPFSNTSQRQQCLACHKDINADMRQNKGLHGRNRNIQNADCRICHTDHKGRNADIVQLNPALFDHNTTDYALKGAHVRTACGACHKPTTPYRNTPQQCIDCHKTSDTHAGKMGTKCATCHNQDRWKQTSFNHDKTRYPLTGKHKNTDCALCHPNQQYQNVPTQCAACHRINDVHNNRYGQNCKQCHSTQGWKGSNFNHDRDTKFRLSGKHKTTQCLSCHKVDFKAKLPNDCFGCHKLDDEHNGRYGKKCQDCHNSEKWSNKRFEHDKETKFALRGKHRDIDCLLCHKGPAQQEKDKTACHQCHAADNVHRDRFGEKCQDCHTETKWKESRYDHDKSTKYPLRGKHREISCHLCHQGPAKNEKDKTRCHQCHQQDDVHRDNFGKQCQDCHNESKWKDARFDHDKKSKFPLAGKHREVKCHLCHTRPVAQDKGKTACMDCHEKRDIHRGEQGKLCQRCHNETTWRGKVVFDHDTTRFPLIGMHATTVCEECHASATFKETKSTCPACHTKRDVHKGKLSSQCQQCHNPNSWKFWQFDHEKTKFKLQDAHKDLNCLACHKSVSEKLALPRDCYSCHRINDVHEGNFGLQCERCHNQRKFKEISIKR